jgi:hypothetical protein
LIRQIDLKEDDQAVEETDDVVARSPGGGEQLGVEDGA